MPGRPLIGRPGFYFEVQEMKAAMDTKMPRKIAFGALCSAAAFIAAPIMAQSFTPIVTPSTGTDNVFVDQIGSGNQVDINQETSDQFIALEQDGNDNIADLTQADDGAHIAELSQDGDDNSATITQSGSAQNVAVLTQTGTNNSTVLFQNNSGLVGSAAEIVQNGSDNGIVLTQDGDDNQARLTQDGTNNTMIATQLNGGNRLEWMQQGSSLSGTVVEQTGNQQMFIMQSGVGNVVNGGSN